MLTTTSVGALAPASARLLDADPGAMLWDGEPA
mgnify:CR=1 FL=1